MVINPGTLVSDQDGNLGVVVTPPAFMKNALKAGDVLIAWIQYTANCVVDGSRLKIIGSVTKH